MNRRLQFNYEPRTAPYPHQVEAVSFLSDREYAALFDEQGLGKTKIIVDTVCRGIAAKGIDGAIVVCKKSLLGTWQAEVAKHSHLKAVQLRGTPGRRGLSFMWFAHFYLAELSQIL